MGGKAGSARNPRRRRAREPGVQLGEEVVRNMVLFGATRVFAEHGLRAASVEHILEAAGIARRTFYRVFRSKEDVAVALYRIGTDSLLESCQRAVASERDPLKQVERCIDVHLANARALGRLMFVLGGEAQRPESPLHARRVEVQSAIAFMLQPGQDAAAGAPLDPLLLRGLILALEAVTRIVLTEGDEGRRVTQASIDRARRVMVRLATAALAGGGPQVGPLPTLD
jgi:AcrR family transcriptional regulator